MRLSEKYQSWFPKISFWAPNGSLNIKSMLNWLPYHINKIRDIYGEENVGIITYKKIAIEPFFRLLGINIQHFGGLRSSNLFKDKKVLVVLGTFFESEDDILDLVEKIFDIQGKDIIIEELENKKIMDELIEEMKIITNKKPKTTNEYDTILEPKRRRRFTDSKDWIYDNDWYLDGYQVPNNITSKDQFDMIKHRIYPVEWIQRAIWDDEMYQAFHRNRGLLNERVIFTYCWFPPKILTEFNTIAVNRDEQDENQLWDMLEKQERKSNLMKSFIKDIDNLVEEKKITIKDIQTAIKNPKKRLGGITTIAKKYKMYNTSEREEIKKFLEHYLKVRGLVK
jgi:hypothetical protein